MMLNISLKCNYKRNAGDLPNCPNASARQRRAKHNQLRIACAKTSRNLQEHRIPSFFAAYRDKNTRCAGAVIQSKQVPGRSGSIRVGNIDFERERFASPGLKNRMSAAASAGSL
jgi:hypothetical protein